MACNAWNDSERIHAGEERDTELWHICVALHTNGLSSLLQMSSCHTRIFVEFSSSIFISKKFWWPFLKKKFLWPLLVNKYFRSFNSSNKKTSPFGYILDLFLFTGTRDQRATWWLQVSLAHTLARSPACIRPYTCAMIRSCCDRLHVGLRFAFG